MKLISIPGLNIIYLIIIFIFTGCFPFKEFDAKNVMNVKASNVLSPVADSYVRSNASTKNFGTQKKLKVNKGSRATMESLVKFSVPDNSPNITRAELKIFIRRSTVDSVEVYRTSNSWTEDEVTWNDRPEPEGKKLADLGNTQKGWVTIDLTGAVKSPGEVSFIFVSGSSGSCIFKRILQ